MRATRAGGRRLRRAGRGQAALGGVRRGRADVALLPTWSIVHSRHWKFQVPYLARHHRVITFDGRGCGLSDRPRGAAAYTHLEFAADTIAVLDATGVEQAVLVAFSCGDAVGSAGRPPITPPASSASWRSARPSRWPRCIAERTVHPFDEPIESHRGLGQVQPALLGPRLRGLPDLLRRQVVHRATLDEGDRGLRGMGARDRPGDLADAHHGLDACGRESMRAVCERVRQPVLVIHGDEDAIRPYAAGVALAEVTGGSLVTVAGGGHAPHCRDPVLVNRALREFIATRCVDRSAVMRALEPVAAGYVERDGVQAALGGVRRRASRRSPCCRRGRSPTRATGSSRCPTSPATIG